MLCAPLQPTSLNLGVVGATGPGVPAFNAGGVIEAQAAIRLANLAGRHISTLVYVSKPTVSQAFAVSAFQAGNVAKCSLRQNAAICGYPQQGNRGAYFFVTRHGGLRKAPGPKPRQSVD